MCVIKLNTELPSVLSQKHSLATFTAPVATSILSDEFLLYVYVCVYVCVCVLCFGLFFVVFVICPFSPCSTPCCSASKTFLFCSLLCTQLNLRSCSWIKTIRKYLKLNYIKVYNINNRWVSVLVRNIKGILKQNIY